LISRLSGDLTGADEEMEVIRRRGGVCGSLQEVPDA